MNKDQILEKIRTGHIILDEGCLLLSPKLNLIDSDELASLLSSLSERIEKLEGKEENVIKDKKACGGIMTNCNNDKHVPYCNGCFKGCPDCSYIGAGGGKVVGHENHNECIDCGLQKGTVEANPEVKCVKGKEHKFQSVPDETPTPPEWAERFELLFLKDQGERIYGKSTSLLKAVEEMVDKKYQHKNNQEHRKDEYWGCPDCLEDKFKNEALSDLKTALNRLIEKR